LQRSYHTLTSTGQSNARKLAEFFSRHGQGLLPMVDLIEQSRMAVDELIDVAGRATIEAVLQLSAEQVAGPRTPGQSPHAWVLTGYAYESIAGKSIKTGQTEGTDDTDNIIEQPSPAARTAPTPEPVTLGALALGAPGLSIWRRKRTSLDGQ